LTCSVAQVRRALLADTTSVSLRVAPRSHWAGSNCGFDRRDLADGPTVTGALAVRDAPSRDARKSEFSARTLASYDETVVVGDRATTAFEFQLAMVTRTRRP